METKKRVAWEIIVILSITVVAIAMFFQIPQRLDWLFQDQMAINLRSNTYPAPNVKLILIDDASVNHLSDFVGRYPWPRGVYAPILDFLSLSGAKHVYFDVLFSEKEESAASHEEFINELQHHDNVSFVGMLTEDFPVDATLPNDISKSTAPLKHVKMKKKHNYQTIYHPIPDISHHASYIPIANIEPDFDGRYREIPLLVPFRNEWLFSLPFSILLDNTIDLDKTNLKTPTSIIPVTDHGTIILNWYPIGIEKFSFSGVLSSWESIYSDEEPLISLDTFKDAIVIIGASAVGLHDLKSTPIHSHLAGAEIQATAVSNLIQNSSLKRSPTWLSYALILFMITFVPFYTIKTPTIFRYSSTLLLPLILLSSMIYSFLEHNLLLMIGGPIIAFLVSYIASIGYNSYSEYLEKQKVKQTFSMYVSPKILKELSQNYKTIKPELGKEREVSILFTDIRNFTSITETSPVDQVIQLLNDYFDAMIEIIQENDGTVDKIIGDAIMAFWNAPIESEDHAFKSVKAAMLMQERLVELNKTWEKEGRITIATGIGINSGNCIIGNIGSKRRVNYTLIGDTVNATARLEALCKTYKEPILLSGSTFNYVNHQIYCDFIDNVLVKGKKEALSIYAPRKLV